MRGKYLIAAVPAIKRKNDKKKESKTAKGQIRKKDS
jgi:hypothetical protein